MLTLVTCVNDLAVAIKLLLINIDVSSSIGTRCYVCLYKYCVHINSSKFCFMKIVRFRGLHR